MMKRASHFPHLSQASLRTMCALILIGCCSALLCSSCSENDEYEIYATIYGKVTDYETGAPLENASVVLSPTSLTVQTDYDGNFTFSNLDAQRGASGPTIYHSWQRLPNRIIPII